MPVVSLENKADFIPRLKSEKLRQSQKTEVTTPTMIFCTIPRLEMVQQSHFEIGPRKMLRAPKIFNQLVLN